MRFIPGQRWISTAQPELGLGTVLRVDGRMVQLAFPATGTVLQYATHSAPLLRAEFRPGERIRGQGRSFVVETVDTEAGTLCYHGAGHSLREGELDDIQSISQADTRLIAARVDENDAFELRLQALTRRSQARGSQGWGILSARIDLLAHQLRVVQAATSRRPPRVLLADEVGLGKTIEAGLILSRLLATGRAARVLILLPEALVLQWYVELWRRFNLPFAIFDEERCEAIEQAGDARNPFDDEQLVVADIGFLRDSPGRAEQALASSWDLVVVDEAHHLAWSPDSASPEYTLVERFASINPGLILLTATPEQLGRSGHFARLRLLDPVRYKDLDQYQREADGYVALSGVVEKLLNNTALSASEREVLLDRIGDDESLRTAIESPDDDAHSHANVLSALIDRHGTGRVMFRNRRAAIGGFPGRVVEFAELDGAALRDDQRQHLLAEFVSDVQLPPVPLQLDYVDDPRLAWLLDLFETHSHDKFFVTCRGAAKVIALEEALRLRSSVRVARFHEGMSLLQHDRNAAYFAQADGARVLLCAEVGSEGRNFQFAHRIVLWDLPLDPDLLEQRIGRLDRIGQRSDIHIHCAAFTGTAQFVLSRWYREGMDAMREGPADGRELLKRFGPRLVELATEHAHGAEEPDVEIDSLIAETLAAHQRLSSRIQQGRDRLLELAAQRADPGADLCEVLREADADIEHDAFVLRLFEHFGVHHDEQASRSWVLDPHYLNVDGFPGLGDELQTITFDRATALAREELPFLRADHPMVVGVIDLLLESEHGNAAFLIDDALPAKTVMLEAVFVLEPVAARHLHADRFLPPLPIRIVVDTRLADRRAWTPGAIALSRAAERNVDLSRYRKYLTTLVPPMLKRCEELARQRADAEISDALNRAANQLGDELARLTALQRINPAVSERELTAVDNELATLHAALPRSLLRLDALRFVCSPNFLAAS